MVLRAQTALAKPGIQRRTVRPESSADLRTAPPRLTLCHGLTRMRGDLSFDQALQLTSQGLGEALRVSPRESQIPTFAANPSERFFTPVHQVTGSQGCKLESLHGVDAPEFE